MRMTPESFTALTAEWPTPNWLFVSLQALEGPFELDVAATGANTKCPRYFNAELDGLAQKWSRSDGKLIRVWMNPPYGKGIKAWVKKAYQESLLGAKVICLLPAYTDKGWWHDFVLPYAAKIYFIKERVKFVGAKSRAMFSSVVVVFDRRIKKQQLHSLENWAKGTSHERT